QTAGASRGSNVSTRSRGRRRQTGRELVRRDKRFSNERQTSDMGGHLYVMASVLQRFSSGQDHAESVAEREQLRAIDGPVAVLVEVRDVVGVAGRRAES